MDIFKLTKSKTRASILRHFFFNVKEKYYLRQLERILNIPVANIRRELIFLEKNGLFEKEKKGKEVYYFLNENMPIFKEIKQIISKTIGVESILKKSIEKIKGISISFIYGSMARGDEDSLSDLDIFIVGEINEDNLLKVVRKKEAELSREINYTIFTESALKKGVKEKKVFLKDVLAGKKTFLVGDNNALERLIGRK